MIIQNNNNNIFPLFTMLAVLFFSLARLTEVTLRDRVRERVGENLERSRSRIAKLPRCCHSARFASSSSSSSAVTTSYKTRRAKTTQMKTPHWATATHAERERDTHTHTHTHRETNASCSDVDRRIEVVKRARAHDRVAERNVCPPTLPSLYLMIVTKSSTTMVALSKLFVTRNG